MFKVLAPRSFILAACCLLFPASAYADPFLVTFGENASAFGFTLSASTVDRDVIAVGPFGDFWQVSFLVEESQEAFDSLGVDVLHVTIIARHVVAPHQEPPSDLIFFFNRTVRSIDFGVGPHFITLDPSGPHLPTGHLDSYLGTLTFSVTEFNRIIGYTFHVEGRHCNECPLIPPEHEIPEPATMLLLSTGLAGVAIKTRKRLKRRKNGQGSQ